MPSRWYRKLLPLILAVAALAGLVPAAAAAAAEPPDPLDRGPYVDGTGHAKRIDPFKLGLATLQEPNSSGGAPGSGSNSSITLQVRGSAFVPVGKPGKSPLIVLVHGNHSSCDAGTAPACTTYKRNDEGYAYLAENLATWGYSVFSLDQDEMMSRQDGAFGKGMHQRRLLIAALLDALYEMNEGTLPAGPDVENVEGLAGTLDFTRIGLMGHSRGGDAVSSFIEYNRMRPEGRRYPLRGVISLAPVDYERRAPYGVPYMTILPMCDGDVSNLQGARMYERGQHREESVYPMIQSAQLGGNHNWYNTVWFADANQTTGSGDDSNQTDDACRFFETPNSIRLSGQAGSDPAESYVIDNSDKLNPDVNTRISSDPARMGDQEKIGLATMSAFFRRYVGGEGAFEPYLTGERAAEGKPQIPASACPSSESGARIECIDRVATSHFAPASERLDVIEPDTEAPLAKSSLGTRLTASGFANPYLKGGGVSPRPEKTASGLAWCNPDPAQTEPGQLGETGYPDAAKPCPLPNATALGGQQGTRENVPINQSYSRQIAVAWDGPASLGTKIPAAFADVSGFKALKLAAGVNFFDARNPERSVTDPEVGEQGFTIAVTDGAGHVAKVSAGDPRYGTALQQTQGSTSRKVHVILRDIRVPLSDLAAQGVDLTDVRGLELLFGGAGDPASGSIQLADVRFEEAAGGSDVLLDSTDPNAGPGEGEPTSGPNPVAEIEETDPSPGQLALPEVHLVSGTNTWVVDDDGAQCPNARFESIQAAVDQASPWDKIVVCPGLYEESSVPINSNANPVETGAKNGLTISKPLKIKGAGAGLVTIKPYVGLGSSLAGTAPFLRDGGGNVVTISRQSLGSSDYNENFTEISGVTIESPSTYAEAAVAFFNTSGRISDSVIGPVLRATSSGTLASRPHGWGIVATNSLLGEGSGTIERQVTVEGTLVTGYQSGGILFDDATGKDGEPPATTPSGIELKGYVADSVVEGAGDSTLIPQTGIQYHAGAAGFIEDSKVTGNMFGTDQRKSVGVLLTGAETGGWYAKGSVLAGNGYGLFNADVTNATVREAAPALAVGNFWGSGGNPVEGPTAGGVEGISGEDAGPDPSVEFEPVLGSEPAIAAVPGEVEDEAPVGAIVDPGEGEEVEAGVATEPVVLADDDFGVSSVSLTADGRPVATLEESPYVFSWAPSADEEGKTVTLEATVTDSSGQVETTAIEVPVKKAEVTPPAGGSTGPIPPAAPKVKIGKVKRLTGKGTALIRVRVPGPGRLVLSGPKVKKVTVKAPGAGNARLIVKAKGKALARLARKGKLKVRVKIVFISADGQRTAVTRTVVLKKK